jgi:hypothetical protein
MEQPMDYIDFLATSDPDDICAHQRNLDRRVEFMSGKGETFRRCFFSFRDVLKLASAQARLLQSYNTTSFYDSVTWTNQ